MARIQSKEKLLYYPTPDAIIDAIVRYLEVQRFSRVRLLDPCAGEGNALSRLARQLLERYRPTIPPNPRMPRLTIETYGIEPDTRRARAAFQTLDHVLHASFFSTTLSNGDSADGGWQGLLLNPPYDTDTEIVLRGRKTRLEVNFLYRGTPKLCAGSILIFIVPQFILALVAEYLARFYEDFTCFRFPDTLWQPDPHQPPISYYQQFEQIVLFARKRRFEVPPPAATVDLIRSWAQAGLELQPLPLEGRDPHVRPYVLPDARKAEVQHFAAGFFEPEVAANLVGQVSTKSEQYLTGVWANKDYFAARVPTTRTDGFGIGKPVAPLKNAHVAVLSVAGIANRAILEGTDGRHLLIKGYSRKVPVVSTYEDEEEFVERVTETFETALWGIDLSTGTFVRVDTGKTHGADFPVTFEQEGLSGFLTIFGSSLRAQVAEQNPPRYTGDHLLPWADAALKELKRHPLGKQREAILAHVHGLLVTRAGSSLAPKREVQLDRSAPVAEMGTGKTFMALSIAYLADRYACGASTSPTSPGTRMPHLFPLIVLCPSVLARKWKREAEQTLPDARVVIAKRIGTPARKQREESPDDEEENVIDATDDLTQFRRFDPSFSGTALSAVGCVDRVVAQIRRELSLWKQQYQQAVARGEEPPRKPCHILIIPFGGAKLGKEWMPVYRLKPLRQRHPKTSKLTLRRDADGQILQVPCCPHCFRALKDERKMAALAKRDEEYRKLQIRQEERRVQRRVAAWEEEVEDPLAIYLTERELKGTRDHRIKRRCSACGGALWQYVAKKPEHWHPASILPLRKEPATPLPLPGSGTELPTLTSTFGRRFPLATYLQRRYRHVFHLLIADEVHEGSDGTALDFARQRLASACGGMLGLTGTLSNGYAGSLFRLYYVLNPQVRRDFGYHELERWIDLYGKRQTTRKTYKEPEEAGHGAASDRRVGKPVIREIAGFAPQGLAYVLPRSTFLELSDVLAALPPYREEVHVVEMDNMLAGAYDDFEATITRELGHLLARGDQSALSSWWNALRHYPNLPYLGWTCQVKKTGEVLGRAPKLPENRLYMKERAIAALVQQEVETGRRVLIYTENSGYYDIMPRLKKILEQKVHGRGGKPLQVAILRSTTVETIDREAWLSNQVAAGCDVLLCNPKLVKVGLDLIDFPTIVYASLPTGIADLRQSSRRPMRPGQHRPVKVVFFLYPTMESRLMHLMAQKMRAALMVEGKLPGEGLVSFGEEEEEETETEMYLHLARSILENLEAGTQREQTMAQAEALQRQFNENAQLEREQNQIVAREAEAEPVTFDPIRVEELSISDTFEPTAPSPSSATQNPAPAAQPSASRPTSPASSGKVTIIHTAVTSGKDAWAALRQQYLRPKKGRKKKATKASSSPDLWSLMTTSASPSEAASSEQPSPAQQKTQRSLWD